MIAKRRLVAIGLAAALCAAGCLTPRQEAVLLQKPQNRVFTPDTPLAPIPEGEAARLAEFDAGGVQNVMVLRLAGDAELARRYHQVHDATLFVVRGEAIVIVEESRYFTPPGSAVILPRMTAYQILRPTGAQEELTALMVFSPPFNGLDVVLEPRPTAPFTGPGGR